MENYASEKAMSKILKAPRKDNCQLLKSPNPAKIPCKNKNNYIFRHMKAERIPSSWADTYNKKY